METIVLLLVLAGALALGWFAICRLARFLDGHAADAIRRRQDGAGHAARIPADADDGEAAEILRRFREAHRGAAVSVRAAELPDAARALPGAGGKNPPDGV